MGQYIDLLKNLNPAGITILVIVLMFFAAVVVRQVMSMKQRTQKSEESGAALASSKTDLPVADSEAEIPLQKPSVLGTGKLKCMAFYGDGLHFTRIPKPIGNTFIADTSMPDSGNIYIVRQLDGRELEAYDPRLEPVVSESTPQRAYFATHWDIVGKVFSYDKEWWKSAPMWLAIGMLIVVGISVLAVLG